MIRLLHDKVAVTVEAKATTSAGGIDLLKETDPDAPARGVVVAIGPGAYNDAGNLEPLEVQVGDIVAFPNNAGLAIPEHGLTIMRESEIIAVVG